jgi:hypothetical protein
MDQFSFTFVVSHTKLRDLKTLVHLGHTDDELGLLLFDLLDFLHNVVSFGKMKLVAERIHR